MAAGIETRHGRTCRALTGGRCNCAPTYRAQVYDAQAGKPIREAFPTLAAARQWRQDAQVALRAGRITADRGPTLDQAAEEWLDQLRAGHIRNRSGDLYKPSAIRGYEHVLRTRVLPQLGRHRLQTLTTRDVQGFVDRLVKADVAPATIDSTLTPLKALYRRATARGDVPTNPTRGIEKPAVRSKLKRVASPAEAAILLDALDPADRPLWATALYAGLRRGELVALRWEDVNLAVGVIHVQRGWDNVEGEIAPKSRQGRRDVPIPAALRDHLVLHRMNNTGDGRVFNTLGHVRGQTERAGIRWAEHGLDPLTLHQCRHTYASLMIAAGVNAKALSTFMGHANIAITLDLYGHLMPGSETEAADLLDLYLARASGTQTGATIPRTIPHPAPTAA
jgi:integrase